MLKTGNLLAESSITQGTGNFDLTAKSGGFVRINVGMGGFGSDKPFPYAIRHLTEAEWEVGIGYLDGDINTLNRDRVLQSSNSDLLVSFSPGSKDVVVDLPAQVGEFILGLARLVYNSTALALGAGKLVALGAYNSTEKLSTAVLASNADIEGHAHGFLPEQIDVGSAGWMLGAGFLHGVDVSGEDDGDPIFLDIAGGFSVGPPATAVVQEVGHVIDSAVSGIVLFRLTQKYVRDYDNLWVTGRTYWPRERVSNANLQYVCNTKHTASAAFATDAANWNLQSPQTAGTAVEHHPVYETPEIKVYTFLLSAGAVFDIDTLAGKTSSGDVTCTLKIAGVAVTGISAVTFNTTKSTKTATAARRVTGGDEVTLDITGTTSPSDLALSLKGTLV